MIESRTYVGVILFFLGAFTMILIPILKLPIFIIYVCLALMLAGSIIRVGIFISALFIFCVWITIIIVLMMILLIRPPIPSETNAEEFVWLISIIITIIEGIFMFIKEAKYRQPKKKKEQRREKKAKKADNTLLSLPDHQADKDVDQPIVKSKDIKKKSEQLHPTSAEIDIKAKSIRSERLQRADDYDYLFNSRFVNQLLKNAGITKETLEAETFMRKWDQMEAKRQLTIYFCPYCLTGIEEKDRQDNGEYLCSWCNARIQKKRLIIEEKNKRKIIY